MFLACRNVIVLLGAMAPLAACQQHLLPVAATGSAPTAAQAVRPDDGSADFQDELNGLAQSINRERASANLEPLTGDPALQSLADDWANHLASHQKIVHRNDLPARMAQGGWNRLTENLFRASALTAEGAVRAWLASPPHRANLLDPRVNRMGLAAARWPSGEVGVVFNGGARFLAGSEPVNAEATNQSRPAE